MYGRTVDLALASHELPCLNRPYREAQAQARGVSRSSRKHMIKVPAFLAGH